MIYRFLFILLLCLPCEYALTQNENLVRSNSADINNNNTTVKNWPVVLADNFIALHPDTAAYKGVPKSRNWNYEQGLIFDALFNVYKMTGNKKYLDYIIKNLDYYVTTDGSIKTYSLDEYNIDNISPGKILLRVYSETKDIKYKKAADLLREQLKTHPRTKEGGFWHKKIYPYQMWLDGLYMGSPFYLAYALHEKESESIDDVANQFLFMSKHAKDSKTGLYYHGWDESKQQKWADSIKGTSPNFWGRAMGWYLVALADVIEQFPKKHPKRNELITIFKDLCASVIKFKDPKTNLWFQVTDKLNEPENYIETSSSSMFIYAFAKGARLGLLKKEFLKQAKNSFDSLTKNYITEENGNLYLQNTVSVSGLGGKPYRDGSVRYYLSEPIRVNDFKGYGPLLLAATEQHKLK